MRQAFRSDLAGETVHRTMAFLQQPRFAVLFILASGLLAYSNSFRVPFIFDDVSSIVDNPLLRKPEILPSIVAFHKHYPGRVVGYLTFALNYRFGGLDVTGYHVVNLAIHLANALLAYALVRLTFRTPRLAGSRLAPRAGTVALLCALLFVVHPVQTQAVTYIIQRLTSLASLFCLLSVVLYAAGRLRMEEGGGWRRGLPGLAGSVLSAVLAMKTKEFSFILPLAVSLYEASFFRGAWKRRFLYLLPVLLTLPVVPLGVLSTGKPAGEILSDVSEQLRMQTDVSRPHYLFTQFRVIVTYLRLLVLPAGQNLDYDYPVYTTFFTPPVFLSFLLLAGLFGLAIYLYGFRLRPRASAVSADPSRRLVGFGILWFFLALSVESSFVPIVDVIFEHRVYLAAFGAFAAFAAAAVLAWEWFFGRAGLPMRVAAAAMLVLPFLIATYQRNLMWADRVTIWEDVVRKSPGKARGYNNLGASLNDAGRPMDAVVVLSQAVRIQPDHAEAYYNLGRSLLFIDRNAEAVEAIRTAIRYEPDYNDAYVNLAAALNRQGRFAETIALLERRLDRLGTRADARFNLGVAYASLGNREAARRELAAVTRLDAGLAQSLAGFLR